MLRNLTIFISLLMFWVPSCGQNSFPIYSVDIDSSVDSSPDAFFDSQKITELKDSNGKNLFIDIFFIKPYRDGYIAVDWNYSIYIFSKDGVLRNKISRRGNGHGEYLNIIDLNFSAQGNLNILDGMKKSILTYSQDGKYLESRTLDFAADAFTRQREDFFFAHAYRTDSKENMYSLLTTDNQLKVNGKFFRYNKPISIFLGARNPFYDSPDGPVFSLVYSGINYSLSSGKPVERFRLDFGKHAVKQKILYPRINNPMDYMNLFYESGCVYFVNTHETTSHIYVDFQCSRSSYIALIDKKTGKSKVFRFKDKDICSSSYLPLAYEDGYLISIKEPDNENEATTLITFKIKQF